MKPATAALDDAQVRKHLLRHVGGLEAMVLAQQDAWAVRPADVGYHQVMIRRLEDILSSWRGRVEEASRRR